MYRPTNYLASSLCRDGLGLESEEIMIHLPGEPITSLVQFLMEVPALIRVRACLTTPLMTMTTLMNGPVIVDGVALKEGESLLLCNQPDDIGNGIVTVGENSTPQRKQRSLVVVTEGTLHARTMFLCDGWNYLRIGGSASDGGAVVTLQSETPSSVSAAKLATSLVGPGSIADDLRVRYLRPAGGATLRIVDNDRGLEVEAPHATNELRPGDIVATDGQMVVDHDFPWECAWLDEPLQLPSLVYRASLSPSTGSVTFQLHGRPPQFPLVVLELDLVSIVPIGTPDMTFRLGLRVGTDPKEFVADALVRQNNPHIQLTWRQEPPDEYACGADNIPRPQFATRAWTGQVMRMEWDTDVPLPTDIAIVSIRLVWWPV